MHGRFESRREAGRRVAEKLTLYRGRSDVLVLALPRGGVPIAEEIASGLHAPLDVLVVQKLGFPGDTELAMGAVGPCGLRVLNRQVIEDFEITAGDIERAALREQKELLRREQIYRAGLPPLDLKGRIAILADDGIATGATMRAAIGVALAGRAARIVVAVPVVAREAYFELRGRADEFVTLHIPKEFYAVGDFYEAFPQLTDAEVCEALAHAVH